MSRHYGIYTCEGCGSENPMRYNTSGGYIPRMCRDCHVRGVKLSPITPRIVTPWYRDEIGNRSRSVEGGA